MSKIATLLFALSTVPFAHAASGPSISVFVDFQSQPSLPSVAEMKEEVSVILQDSGLSLDWHLLNEGVKNLTIQDLIVLKFTGSCQVVNPALDSELGPAIEHTPLASTAVSDGRILPFADVQCNAIRRFLSRDLIGYRPLVRDQIFGKALGRVVAHEIYHIVASTPAHAKDGVARESHTRRELTEKQFRFSARETALLHARWQALLAGEAASISWQH